MAIYAFIIFCFCFGLTAAFEDLPPLIQGQEKKFLFLTGLRKFLQFLPGICLSGFAVGCAVVWQKKTGNSFNRFSQGMFRRYRMSLFASFIFVLLLSLNEEVFLSSIDSKISDMKKSPAEFSTALIYARRLLVEKNPSVALQYARYALDLSPDSEIARSLLKQAEDELSILHYEKTFGRREAEREKMQKPLKEKDSGYTIKILMEKSDEAAEKKQWFDAHYWAQLAVEACSGTNTNLDAATERANFAWKMLSNPVEFDNQEQRRYYATKKEGYTAYNAGDFLKAYYVFAGLKNSYSYAETDPDVVKFLALSQEEVENQYFFFDETEFMNEITESNKIYFSVRHPDGQRDVFYIGKAVDIKKDGSLVRYLQDLYVVRFDETDDFSYSFHVPFAKAVAVPVSEFDPTTLLGIGLDKKWKFVPMIILRSIDRNSEGIMTKPEFSFVQSGIPEEILRRENLTDVAKFPPVKSHAKIQNESMMLIPMPFSDFHLINEASSGAGKMSLVSLNKFLPRASSYGFSKEIFAENLVHRGAFPFVILVLFIFCACLGWNYRIEDPEAVFKFRWLFLIPFFGAIMIAVFNIVLYFVDMLNYIFVGVFGLGAIFAAAVVYIALFVLVSIMFLSRKV